MARSTQYLYGIDPSEIRDMRYEDALEYKLNHAKDLFARMTMDRMVKSYEDEERLHYVYKAMRHTQNLLKELRES